MVVEKFQIYSVKITANTFVGKNIESVHFYSCPQAKLYPRFLSLFPRQTGIFSEMKGDREGYGVQKITKIKKGIGHKF